MDTTFAAPSRRVEMWYEGTAPQRRLTVGFRIFLLIPQAFVLFFLYIAAIVVVIIGWFGALFMGRLPQWVHSFASGVLRWSTRVSAYGYLLTDHYPPFSFEDEAYPARPIMPEPGPLNRWSVLFRWILVIPGAVFVQIVRYGLTFPLLIVAWFIVLIGGRMPPVLYAPYSALVRYEIRLSAWFWMLTSEYSWGMLGDRAAPEAPGPPPPPPPSFAGPAEATTATEPAAAAPAAWGAPGAGQSVHEQHDEPEDDAVPGEHGEPADDAGPAAPGAPGTSGVTEGGEEKAVDAAPPQWPPPVPPPGTTPAQDVGSMPPPSPWERVGPAPGSEAEEPGWGRLVLTGAARGWMIAAIVWGSVLFVSQNAIQAAVNANNSASTVQQFNTTSSDVAEVNRAVLTAAAAAGSCTNMSSVAPSQQDAASKLTKLADDLSSMSLPDNANNSARAVESDATQLAAIFRRLGAAPDCTTYRDIGRSSNFATVLNSYPSDVGQLLSVLHADATS